MALSINAYCEEVGKAQIVLTLPECESEALANNPEIQAARAQIEKQSAVIGVARSELLPQIDLFAESSKTEVRGKGISTANPDQELLSSSVEFSQSLYSGGANGAHLAHERFLLKAAKYSLAAKSAEILLRVRKQFFDSLLAFAQINVQEQLVNLLSEQLESETLKRNSGKVSDFNVLRAEVALANSRAPLIRAQNNYRLQLETLARTMGRSATGFNSDAIRLQGQWRGAESLPALQPALQAAKSLRHEVSQLRSLISSEQAGRDVAYADYLPKLIAFANYQTETLDGPELERQHDKAATVGVRLSWKLFDSLRTASSVREADSRKRLAVIELEREQLEIELEVKRAYSALLEALALLAAAGRTSEQAQESVRLARARLDAGVGTLLDVLDSQVALTQARTNEIEAQHDYSVAFVEFEYATAHRGAR